jgi:hypothetical protein
MTWVQEWKSMLQTKAHYSTHIHTVAVDPDMYDLLRVYCLFHDIIFFPSMYDEYIQYLHDHSLEPNDQHMAQYVDHSTLIQEQLQDVASVRQLETVAKKERLRFYEGDSVMEKVALAAHYFGQRGGG